MFKILECADLNHLMVLKRQLDYVIFGKQLHISKLPNDILVRHIYSKLSLKDRLAFAQALTWEKHCLLKYYDMLHFYVTDTMIFQLQSCVNMLADVALYSSSCSLIFADWSGFGCLRQAPLAKIYWSQFAPHMRVEMNEYALRKCANRMYRKKKFACRISIHETLEHIHLQLVSAKDVCLLLSDQALHYIRWMPHFVREVVLATPKNHIMFQH